MPWIDPLGVFEASFLNKCPSHPEWLCQCCSMVAVPSTGGRAWSHCLQRDGQIFALVFFGSIAVFLAVFFILPWICGFYWWCKSSIYRRSRVSFHHGYALVPAGNFWEAKIWKWRGPTDPPPRYNLPGQCILLGELLLLVFQLLVNVPMILYSCCCCDQHDSIYMPTEVCQKGEELAILLPEQNMYQLATFVGVEDQDGELRAKFMSRNQLYQMSFFFMTLEELCDGERCRVVPSCFLGHDPITLEELLCSESVQRQAWQKIFSWKPQYRRCDA